MKNLTDFINEQLEVNEELMVNEGEVSSEEDFREYAENKFKEVFGDDLDEEEMNNTIEGILNDNKDAVEDGDWGKLVGILNKSF